MKSKFLLPLFFSIAFCACSKRGDIGTGWYVTMSVLVTEKANADSVDWTKIPGPVFYFSEDNTLRISSDYLSSFGDTLFRYRFTNNHLILRNNNGKSRYEYKLMKQSDRTRLSLFINSKYLKTIDIISTHE